VCPDERVGSAKEGVDIFGFAGDGVEHFAGDSGVVLNGLGKGWDWWDDATSMSAWVEAKAGEAGSARALAVKGRETGCWCFWGDRWWRRQGLDLHPRK
jgi:hypothetical protein